MDRFAVILPAAGRSVRFGGPRNKLLEHVGGLTVIRRAVNAFLARQDVGAVVLATSPGATLHEALGAEAGEALDARLRSTPGGASRAESVRLALEQVPPDIDWVAVHDAARPLVSQDLISRTFAAAREHGAAVPAMPVPLTIKQAHGPLPAPVERTLPRHTLWAMQTPQAMRRAVLLAAYEQCPLPLDQITDDAQLLELAGQSVWLIPGEERNLKLTTMVDLQLAESFLNEPSA